MEWGHEEGGKKVQLAQLCQLLLLDTLNGETSEHLGLNWCGKEGVLLGREQLARLLGVQGEE